MTSSDPWYSYMRFVNENLSLKKFLPRSFCKKMLVLGPGSGEEVANIAALWPDIEITFVKPPKVFRKY